LHLRHRIHEAARPERAAGDLRRPLPGAPWSVVAVRTPGGAEERQPQKFVDHELRSRLDPSILRACVRAAG
jgi:hypothetical protein